jgi:hypothetical protein
METPNLDRLLTELKTLDLPLGHFAIFGSAPLAIRGLRDSHDLDIIVSDELYEKLKIQYSGAEYQSPLGFLKINDFEISNQWMNDGSQVSKMIDEAEMVNGWLFVTLPYVIAWKTSMGRAKDKIDLEMLNEYLKLAKS